MHLPQISTQKKKTGVIQPKRFVQRVKRDNELFRSYMHQDAHEFLNFLLNEAHDILEKQARERQAATRVKTHGPTASLHSIGGGAALRMWVFVAVAVVVNASANM